MIDYTHGLPMYLTDDQVTQLLKPINSLRVGKDGKGFSHVEAYEIRAHLNRIFGFARWSEEVTAQELVFEDQHPMDHPDPKLRGKWTVCYRSLVRLTVRSPEGSYLAEYLEGASGDATNMPYRADAHDMALKTSQSQAFKRCAMNLGDQFGLSLYNKGSLRPIVGKVLVGMSQVAEQPAAEVDAHITTPLAPERDAETPQREVSSRPGGAPAAAPVVQEPPGPPPAGVLTGEMARRIEDSLEKAAGDAGVAYGGPALGVEETAVANVEAAFPGAVEASAEEKAEPGPWDWCLTQLLLARRTEPTKALGMLKAVQETATRHQLRARKMEDGTTLGATVVALMQRCNNAIAQQAGPSTQTEMSS